MFNAQYFHFQLLVCDGWNSDKAIEDESSEQVPEHVPEPVFKQSQEIVSEPEIFERPKSAQEKVGLFLTN